MASNITLSDAKRRAMNGWLKDLEAIREDIQTAQAGNVPHMEQAKTACEKCIEDIKALKKAYFPNKP